MDEQGKQNTSLTFCTSCKVALTPDSAFCNHCGAAVQSRSLTPALPPAPPLSRGVGSHSKLTVSRKLINKLALVLCAIGLGIIVIAIISNSQSSPNQQGTPSTQPGQTTPASDSNTSVAPAPDSPALLDDASALDQKYGIEASVSCESEADDYLRSVAKFDFKWDDTGWLENKFDKYSAKVRAPGVLTSISNKAKLQNGFGAFQHVELFCDYDTQNKKVLEYRIIQSDQ